VSACGVVRPAWCMQRKLLLRRLAECFERGLLLTREGEAARAVRGPVQCACCVLMTLLLLIHSEQPGDACPL
jgi:hypothetical protein